MENQQEYNYNIINPDRTGKFIKAIRLYHNMTQDDLAELLFITRKAVSKWETGSGYPSIDVAKRLCDTFGISFEELIAGKYIEKNKRLVFNSSVISIIIVLSTLCFTLYKDYLNKFDIYKYSFQSKSINIVNNKIMLSKKHKIYSFGEININDNTVPKDIKLKINLFLKGNNELLYTCDYYKNKCHKKFINTKITKKELSNNLNNIFLTVTYKDNKNKVISLEEQKLKINNNGNGTKKVLPKKVFIEPYLKLHNKKLHNQDPLLYKLNNRADIVNKPKTIDLSFLYELSSDVLYKKYNNIIVKEDNNNIKIKVKNRNIYMDASNGIYVLLNLRKNIITINNNNKRIFLNIKSNKILSTDLYEYNEQITKIIEYIQSL